LEKWVKMKEQKEKIAFGKGGGGDMKKRGKGDEM